MTENQKLREALQAYIDAGFGNSTDPHKQGAAYDLAIEALALPTAAPAGEREEFEQFAQNCPMGKYNVTRRGEGYDSSHTQIMWDAWQSGRTALRAGDAVDAQRTPLTDEQMWSLWNSQGIDEMNQSEAIAFARDVERAHGIEAAMRKGQL